MVHVDPEMTLGTLRRDAAFLPGAAALSISLCIRFRTHEPKRLDPPLIVVFDPEDAVRHLMADGVREGAGAEVLLGPL